jgi:hypothetical protein
MQNQWLTGLNECEDVGNDLVKKMTKEGIVPTSSELI